MLHIHGTCLGAAIPTQQILEQGFTKCTIPRLGTHMCLSVRSLCPLPLYRVSQRQACSGLLAPRGAGLTWGAMPQDSAMAALAMQRALELNGEEPQWRSERDRLLLCVPEQISALLQVRPARVASGCPAEADSPA